MYRSDVACMRNWWYHVTTMIIVAIIIQDNNDDGNSDYSCIKIDDKHSSVKWCYILPKFKSSHESVFCYA